MSQNSKDNTLTGEQKVQIYIKIANRSSNLEEKERAARAALDLN